MEKNENSLENIGLSLKQEIEKEKVLADQIFWVESPKDAEVLIEDYKVFVENSTHEREPLMVAACVRSMEKRTIGSDIDEMFAEQVAKELFPVIYKKIAFGKEIPMDHFKELGLSIGKYLQNEKSDTTSKNLLERSFTILCKLLVADGEK